MAKTQLIDRFAVDIAPSQLSSMIIRRRRALPRVLDTIAEEEVVERPSYAPHSFKSKAPLQSWSYTSAVVHGEQKPAVLASPGPIVA
ncbi:hypothetical protein PR202_gb14347 [Eleusine coracana subsp. coracana]|uniref:Uncharacterized protein n=1 Tax=Eleusine coracana subsp. coracana TaxID=191504 RepID=A0AAV5EV83_ELECO|nr:hypothetical protein PR202_gb14347 [Eleusine coracana subsp. coracana]